MFLFVALLISTSSYSQVVTSSFNRAILGINPASSTTRHFGQVSINYNIEKNDSDIDLVNANGSKFNWNEKLEIEKKELLLAGSKGRVVPELYLSHEQGDKTIKLVDDANNRGDQAHNKLAFFNNMVNLGWRYRPWLGLGIKMAYPVLTLKGKFDSEDPDGTTYTGNFKERHSVLTIGTGATFKALSWLYFGAFTSISNESNSGFIEGNDFEGKDYRIDLGDDNSVSRSGIGISILSGQSFGKGFRLEVSYSQMDIPKDPNNIYPSNKKGEEMRTSLEIAYKGLSFGGNVRLIKYIYYDQNDLVSRYFGEKTYNQNFEPSFGGFLSLRSARGHSLGLSGYYWVSKGDRPFQGLEAKAKTKTTNLVASYAYVY